MNPQELTQRMRTDPAFYRSQCFLEAAGSLK